MFLRNAWYVAGWSTDFTRELRGETFLGDSICFYRKENDSRLPWRTPARTGNSHCPRGVSGAMRSNAGTMG